MVIIRIDDVDLGSLPEDLRERSVIDYGSNHEKPHWKRKLLEFLGVPHKYKRESTKSNDTEVSVLEPVNGDVFENGHELPKWPLRQLVLLMRDKAPTTITNNSNIYFLLEAL